MEAKKQLGQHFLINEGVALKIAKQCGKSKLPVVEVGPGEGALTEKLLNAGRTVIGIEIDRRLIPYLGEKFKKEEFFLVIGDAAQIKVKRNVVVCGNLPYNASKAIIKNFIMQYKFVPQMIFMVQKEVAETITAQTGSKAFSKFSVLCQLFYDTAKLFDVMPGSFRPKPKVISSVVVFRRKAYTYDIDNDFFKFLNKLFLHPRKTVKNNLKPFDADESLKNKRPSDLTVDEIYRIWREKWQNRLR